MSKMIVIEKCEKCPCSYRDVISLKIVLCDKIRNNDGTNRRCPKEGVPDWCPLPGIPKKFDIHKQFGKASQEAESMGISEEQWFGYMGGWNDCLEEIKGEEER